ncbi:TPA: CoA transferase [Candidatus Bathyarchaeota archaeon]|nr:CoA transferase [Candidatus Bathyarchaeota archaeon]
MAELSEPERRELEFFSKITVLSHEQATTLPFLTYLLAAEGMNVIRLEDPVRGDPNRRVGEPVLGEDGMYTYYLPNNVGKKAITLNLAEEEGREILKELVKKLNVDVFATNTLPKRYGKLGVDYETLRGVKKNLIWVGITGFGPESNEPAYDPILQARCGYMEITGEKEGPPMVFGVPIVDLGASLIAYGQVMKALFRRAVTGEGCRVDISMFQGAVSIMVNPIMMTVDFGKEITRRGNTHEFFAPVSVYPARDGYVYIAVGNDRQWEAMTKLRGFENLYSKDYETNAGRIADVDNLNRKISEATKKFTVEELIQMFNSIGVPVSKINTIEDVVKDPYVNRYMVTAKDPRTGREIHLPPPPSITAYLKSVNFKMRFPPRMGEHNEEVYCEILGYSRSELEKLKSKGII